MVSPPLGTALALINTTIHSTTDSSSNEDFGDDDLLVALLTCAKHASVLNHILKNSTLFPNSYPFSGRRLSVLGAVAQQLRIDYLVSIQQASTFASSAASFEAASLALESLTSTTPKQILPHFEQKRVLNTVRTTLHLG